jgi:hypothetical protein
MASRVGGRDYPASDVASKIAFNRLRRSTLITFLLMPYWFVLVLGFFRSARSSLSCLRSSSERFSQSRCTDPVVRLESCGRHRSPMSLAQCRVISDAANPARLSERLANRYPLSMCHRARAQCSRCGCRAARDANDTAEPKTLAECIFLERRR